MPLPTFFFTKILLGLSISEAIVKMIGLRYHYFTVPWNVFDFLLVLASILGILMEDIMIDFPVSPTLLRVVRVFRIGRILRLIKVHWFFFEWTFNDFAVPGCERDQKAAVCFGGVFASAVQHWRSSGFDHVYLCHYWDVSFWSCAATRWVALSVSFSEMWTVLKCVKKI